MSTSETSPRRRDAARNREKLLEAAAVAFREEGLGASVNFLEQESEKAATNGTIIGPDRTAYTVAAEASGRS